MTTKNNIPAGYKDSAVGIIPQKWEVKALGEAYKLQEQGDDTVEANVHLGFQPDERDYGIGAQILQLMGARKLRLMTNNPVKRVGLESFGIEIVENLPIEIAPNPYNLRYMQTKKEKMYHNLNLV